jgi:carboxyl-terminal processing protease
LRLRATQGGANGLRHHANFPGFSPHFRRLSPAARQPWYFLRVQRRLGVSLTGIVLALGALGLVARPPADKPLEARRGLALSIEHQRHLGDEEIDGTSCDRNALDRGLVMPTGEPTSVTCNDARTVVNQARSSLAGPVAPVDPAKFAAATVDWLDPHGLWSVAPDAPIGALVRRNGERLLAELEAPLGSGPCVTARAIGIEMAAWADELRAIFDEGEREGEEKGRALDRREAWKLATSTPYEDGAVTRSARELARDLGRHAGALRAAYGPAVAPFVEAVRARSAPQLVTEAWANVVTAAALRSYIPQLDAHGAWAPLDEELSIYDLALEAEPPARLWTDRIRTAIGVRIDRGALAPLQDGDVVLSVAGVPVAGMSVEQVEQLSVLSDSRPGAPTKVIVLRAHHPAPIELSVVPPKGDGGEGPVEPAQELAVTMARYGEGRAAVIAIPDVPDDLGTRLSLAIDRAKSSRDLRGLVLDLRANGGGSTDGATAALGLFIPGAALFPMRRRDGGLEVEHAPDVPADKRFNGPLAVLVDGDSASAAEMIAGALASYHRAVVIGDRTYGKGCAQEYLDDDAHAGVLRLTTLLFALPDGSPVQKTGIVPNLQLSLPAASEREASLTRALGPWRGPDVRDPAQVKDVPWPNHGGRVGPCRDATVCRALRALGSNRAAAR